MSAIKITEKNGVLTIISNDESKISDPSLIGTKSINKTVRYLANVEQEDGSFKEEIRTYALAGTPLSKEMFKTAREYQKKYKDLQYD